MNKKKKKKDGSKEKIRFVKMDISITHGMLSCDLLIVERVVEI